MELPITPRQYQQRIFETARNSNTLVVLPTGLGKTLIGLLLAVERIKKFPGSKILFLAPTRPLAEQHLKTFKKNLRELFADLQLFTGSVKAKKRQKIFQTAEIIFSTPQCIANDLNAGLYSLQDVSLLIIDEAHRCLKNYDYTKVVEFYKKQANKQRILGLTASPGSNKENVKEICKHLDVQEIELRTRDSEDVRPYLQELNFKRVDVPFPEEFIEIKILLKRIYDTKVEELRNRKLLFGPATKVTLLQLQKRLAAMVGGRNFNAMLGMSTAAQAIKLSHALELLETQTLSGLKDYFEDLVKQANEKKSKGVQRLVKEKEFLAAKMSLENLLSKGFEHPKIAETAAIIENQFNENENSKVIVFTQFRNTALKIIGGLKGIEKVKASTFFGQAKKNNTGYSQKEQKEVLEKLNSGEINFLVATSIGEEGLDISEVSVVIFYEPIPSAIRKIQRTGRTARLSPGKLFILVTKDTRDVAYHYASTAREKKMYQTIEGVREEIKNGKKDKTLGDFK